MGARNTRLAILAFVISAGVAIPFALGADEHAASTPVKSSAKSTPAKPAATKAEPGAKTTAHLDKPAPKGAVVEHDEHEAADAHAAKPIAKTDSAAPTKADAKKETKPAPKAEAKTESKTETKAEAKPAAKPEPKAEAKTEPKPAPKAETPKAAAAPAEETPSTPDAAIESLKAGNARWTTNASRNPNVSLDRRDETEKNGQKPFATILTCADSRLPVERIFDRGVGDLFVVRVAGNVIGDHTAGTIEYGAEHLHTPLLVVMGHTKCGAVKAACEGGHAGGNIDSLLEEIQPAVDRAKIGRSESKPDEILTAAVRENVWQSVYDLLKNSPDVRQMVASGELKVVGAVCDIHDGKVEFLGEHPWQTQLLDAMGATTTDNVAKAAKAHGKSDKAKAAPKAATAEDKANEGQPDHH